jgi:multisubunit Na+/H+ antiporter MnhC subunit
MGGHVPAMHESIAVPTATTQEVTPAKKNIWQWLVRSLVLTSVVVNIAVVLTALLTSLWEVDHPAGTLNASTTELHTITSASLEP